MEMLLRNFWIIIFYCFVLGGRGCFLTVMTSKLAPKYAKNFSNIVPDFIIFFFLKKKSLSFDCRIACRSLKLKSDTTFKSCKMSIANFVCSQKNLASLSSFSFSTGQTF